MASLADWLSPEVMRALGWALIHSLWQCVAVAALAAVVMAFLHRPALRYLTAVTALAVMLVLPAATFLVLVTPAAPDAAAFASPIRSAAPQATTILAAPFVAERAIGVAQPDLLPRLLPFLVTAWLCGVAFFSLRFAGGFLLLEHKCRRQSFAPDPRILALCHEVQQRLGLNRAVRYLECSWLQTPAVIGWLRPIVLLPVCALTGLSQAQLRAVIAHELAHIRRFDALVNLFQIMVETLLFYHPAIWWLNKRIRAERELCCDEIALSAGADRFDYAKALTLMAQWEAPPALAMAATGGVLSERVFHILGRPSSSAGQRMLGLTGSVLFLVAALACANALVKIAAPPIAQASAAIGKRVNAVVTQIANDRTLLQALAGIAPPQIKEPAPPPALSGQNADQSGRQNASQNERLIPPQTDLSGLVPAVKLTTPAIVVSRIVQPVSAPGKPGPGDAIHHCSNQAIYGIAISAKAIAMLGFSCFIGVEQSQAGALRYNYGSCPLASTTRYRWNTDPSCKYDVVMNVRLADPADAAKMVPGKLVRLAGDFRATTENRLAYLAVLNARVVWADPFGLAAKIEPVDKPVSAVQAPELSAPGLPLVQASMTTPPAQAPVVHDCRNKSVFGQVISPKLVAIQGFTCFADAPGNTITARDIPLGACPLASTTTAHKYKCKFDVNLNVRLAYPSDAAKMVPGKLVRLGGDFQAWKLDKLDYVTVANARVLFTDYYWLGGISDLPLPMGMPSLPDMSVQAAPPIPQSPPVNQGPNLQAPP